MVSECGKGKSDSDAQCIAKEPFRTQRFVASVLMVSIEANVVCSDL